MRIRSSLAALLTTVMLAACGSAQQPDAAAPTGEAAAPTSLHADDSGALELVEPGRAFADGTWVALVPQRWPDAELPRPHVGLGRVHHDGDRALLTIWVTRQADALDALAVAPVDGPAALQESKLLIDVLAVDGGTVTLGAGSDLGVSAGDVYHVLNAGFDEPRPGAAIGALLRVTDTAETTSVARIEHADIDVEAGDLARFAQASLDRPPPTATLVLADVDDSDEGHDALSTIASALPEYLAHYALSNVAIVEYDGAPDPTPYDAPRNVSDAVVEAVDGAFGTVVFGRREGGRFIYNLTTFGDAPQGDSTVGVLPGGLPLPVDDDLQALSTQLVPSFLANILAQRGDHAQAVYLLESVLRTVELDPALRYHLREHLALRYASLGQYSQALSLMSHDIDEARAADAAYPLLNALSIRAYLDTRAGLFDQWLEDTRGFLEAADGVLPAEALGFERLAYARALRAADQLEEATQELYRVQEFASEMGDEDLHISALIDMSETLARRDDEPGAQLVLGELLDIAQGLEAGAAVGVYLNAAEMYAMFGERTLALEQLDQAIRDVETNESQAVQAAVYHRASDVLSTLNLPAEAWRTLHQASMLFLDTAQYDYAASALIRLGLAQIEQALTDVGERMLFNEGRRSLLVGAELSLRIGHTLDAAQALVWLGMLEYNAGSESGAEVFLNEAWSLAWRSGHLETLAFIDAQRAQMAAAREAWDVASEHQQRAQTWIDAGELDMELEPIEQPSY